MGPYLKDMGGPMTLGEIRDLVGWLMVQANARFAPSRPEELAPVRGDTRLGKQIYERNCKSCHGTKGEGGGGKIRGTALGNTAMLSVTPDSFIQRAIVQGRQNTNMPSWAEKLTDHEIDSTVAFLRTRAKGWTAGFRVIRKPPAPENYVLNAAGRDPVFRLSDGRYVMADELRRALAEKRKMVVLDTRVPYFWAMANIPGSVPIPYYSNFDSVIANLPTDGTWIVAYCECPRAEADQVVTELRKRGFDHTAVLWEGYGGWTAKGFPIEVAKVN
jgi:mono/diheme cytochrome c family protein/rhodanese-related sulfurtransferase